MKKIYFILLLFICVSSSNAQLVITPKTAGQAASVVTNDLLSTYGLFGTPSNVTFTGGPQGLGTFTGGTGLGKG